MGIISLITVSHQLQEGRTFPTLQFVPEVVSTLKRSMDQVFDDSSLPNVSIADIGHIRKNCYDLTLNDGAAELQMVYLAEGVLPAESWTHVSRRFSFYQMPKKNASRQLSTVA